MAAAGAIDLFLIVSESSRIISAHARHFLSLCVLFLLPLSSLLLLLPTFFTTPSDSSPQTLLRSVRSNALPFRLLYAAALLLFAVCAVAAVTRSVRNGFYGRPVKFASALRALSASLPRLTVTFICAASVFAAVAAVARLGLWAAEMLGLHPLDSPPVVAVAVVAGLLVFLLIFLHSRWALFPVIVVAEGKWGIDPLRRSSFLLSGARMPAVSLGFVTAGGVAGMVLISGFLVAPSDGIPEIVGTICELSAMIVLMLYGLAANTVLYMYCKAMRGELVGEIAAEFDREYVSLPFDDQKVPRLISVVRS